MRYTIDMLNNYNRKRIDLGLRFGLVAGIVFSLAAWGIDTVILVSHHSAMPFLKFIAGFIVCVPAATLSGYLTARQGKGYLGLLFWGGLAVLLSFMVVTLPTKFYPWFLQTFRPELSSFVRFEELVSSGTNWFYCLFAIGLTCLLCGLLENLLIEQALASSSGLGPLMPLVICALVMLLAGIFGDLLVTSDFRKPIVSVDTLLENSALYYDKEVDFRTARELHLDAAKPLGELVLGAHRLTLVEVDRYLTLMKVLVEFEGQTALCQSINSLPTFCSMTSFK